MYHIIGFVCTNFDVISKGPIWRELRLFLHAKKRKIIGNVNPFEMFVIYYAFIKSDFQKNLFPTCHNGNMPYMLSFAGKFPRPRDRNTCLRTFLILYHSLGISVRHHTAHHYWLVRTFPPFFIFLSSLDFVNLLTNIFLRFCSRSLRMYNVLNYNINV